MPEYPKKDLINCSLQTVGLVPELTSYVNVGGLGSHGEADHECALDQLVRIAPHDLSVFASSWL
jgi:hypothetical protein